MVFVLVVVVDSDIDFDCFSWKKIGSSSGWLRILEQTWHMRSARSSSYSESEEIQPPGDAGKLLSSPSILPFGLMLYSGVMHDCSKLANGRWTALCTTKVSSQRTIKLENNLMTSPFSPRGISGSASLTSWESTSFFSKYSNTGGAELLSVRADSNTRASRSVWSCFGSSVLLTFRLANFDFSCAEFNEVCSFFRPALSQRVGCFRVREKKRK